MLEVTEEAELVVALVVDELAALALLDPEPLEPPLVGPSVVSNLAMAAQKVLRLSLSNATLAPSRVIMFTEALVLIPNM